MGCGASKQSAPITEEDRQALSVPAHRTLIYVKRNLRRSKQSDDFLLLGKVPLPHPLSELSIHIDWNDQGFGNSKGEVLVRLMQTEDGLLDDPQAQIHMRPAPKAREIQNKVVNKNDAICEKSSAGFWLHVLYKVGGGGGHALSIHRMGLSCVYETPDLATAGAGGTAEASGGTAGASGEGAVFMAVD